MGQRSRGVYNRTYTPELWDKVNKENKELLNDFIAEYTQQKKSKGTIKGYYEDLRIIFIHILQRYDNRSILELKKKDFRNISLWLSDESNLSANRVNRMKSAMNSLLTFAEDDDDYDYDINYSKKVKGLPREKVKQMKTISFLHIKSLFKSEIS
jgi:Phage integrase, N-terminal SAM-like domain.